MENSDGGPAFPRPCGENQIRENDSSLGMSLRDYFAAAALTGSREDISPEEISKSCYKIADAMLAERVK